MGCLRPLPLAEQTLRLWLAGNTHRLCESVPEPQFHKPLRSAPTTADWQQRKAAGPPS